MTRGPLMLDLAGTDLTPAEREMLQHPAAGGVILFSRNFQSPDQIYRLVAEIHKLRDPALLIAVDQEGGRVQRFREGFTRLPPVAWFGTLYDADSKHAHDVARETGWLMATELRTVGVDFSFAPVLDLGGELSKVIGDRAFDQRPVVVTELAQAWMTGVHDAGMIAVGKHFPGHGGVREDSHHELPVDRRDVADILSDLMPFERMISYGLEAIMPAHVIYPQADPQLAGFSSYWLQDILRGRFRFQGAIFSDDLSMAAADAAGDYGERAMAALEAGCDMVLVCNNPEAAGQVLEALKEYQDPVAQTRLLRMHGRHQITRDEMHLDPRWQAAVRMVGEYDETLSLSLNL
ncbi:beta-N-acetylglucosaminidase [hydrothermal vent metagenome]|uniref:beta-N-acetylhexosaminidase n=1 Tax=hydrothermal vent metagenome TaxID=652676 RepID=A0A3B1AMG1_9ZZZZ